MLYLHDSALGIARAELLGRCLRIVSRIFRPKKYPAVQRVNAGVRRPRIPPDVFVLSASPYADRRMVAFLSCSFFPADLLYLVRVSISLEYSA